MYDAIVIGGGPAGSTVATRLAQKGRRVLVLERERMPRFHIGESLLPCSMPLFEQLGVAAKLADGRFLPKHAAEFVTADGTMTRRYPFAEGVVPGPSSAYEVDRAEFDQLLLDNAAECGAEVRQGWDVKSFTVEAGKGARVVARDESGQEQLLEAQMLIDASGQRSFIGSKLGLKQMDGDLKNVAVFSHYEGAERASGDREGDISVVLVPQGWWWVIPLRNDRTSVGLVAPARSLRGRKPDESYWAEQIESTPYLKKRLASARRVAPVRTASDYSYVTSRKAGDHWLAVGDAASFIDPVFSTGVYLGMVSAFRAAEVVHRALERRRFGRSEFIDYERYVTRAVGAYSDFVKGFYTPEFVEVMMHPSDTLQLRQAVTSLLAGHGFDRMSVGWRIMIFRAITLANKRWRLTPRLPGRREAATSL